MTITLSDRNNASPMSWVTNTTVVWDSCQIRSSSRFIWSRVCASSAPKGSSISRIEGSTASARATDTRCCMPPESSPGRCCRYSDRPTISSTSWALRLSSSVGRPMISNGSITLSSTLRHGSSTAFWKT